jgi:uncharacterized coiled-coil protein SlyX
MPITDEMTVTELVEITPDRVDAVGSPANGTEFLILKSLDSAAEKSHPTCDVCNGDKTSGDLCKKCRGTGLMPRVGMTVKDLAEAVKASDGIAPSGTQVPIKHDCPTCKGTGILKTAGDENHPCPDCDGSGRDGQYASGTNEVDGFPGSLSVGDPQHREKADKALCDDQSCEACKSAWEDMEVEKAKLKYAQRKKLPKSAFAIPATRSYPIHDEAHARNALARVSQFGTPEEKAQVSAAVHRRYPNIEVGGKDSAEKASDVVEKDGVVSGSNPFLGATVTTDTPSDSSDDGDDDGDAQIDSFILSGLLAVADALCDIMTAQKLDPDHDEVNGKVMAHIEDAKAMINHAIVDQAMDSAGYKSALEKAGERLSAKSVTHITKTRDAANQLVNHLTELLGDYDPSKQEDSAGKSASEKFMDRANKELLTKEIDEMTGEELIKLLDERDEANRAGKEVETTQTEVETTQTEVETTQPKGDETEAEKGKPAADEHEAVANAKAENSKAKGKKPKEEEDDLEDEVDHMADAAHKAKPEVEEREAVSNAKREKSKAKKPKDENDKLEDEADQGTDTSASGTRDADGGAKSVSEESTSEEFTPEEIEANQAVKAAKKEAKRAKKAAIETAEQAKIAKAITETVAQTAEVVKGLQDELEAMKQRLVPSDVSRTRPPEVVEKAAEHDALELEAARWERLADTTPEHEFRKEYRDRARAVRVKLAEVNN